MTSQQDLHNILSKFLQYSQRNRPKITLQQLPTVNPDDFVNHVNTQIERQSFLLDQLIKQSTDLIKAIFHTNQELNMKIDDLQKQILIGHLKIDQIQYSLGNVQKQKQVLLARIIQLEEQIHVHKMTIEELHRNFQQQKIIIKQKLADQENFRNKNFQVAQQIKEQNESINKQFRQTYNEKTQLQQQVNDLHAKIQQKDQQLAKKEGLINWQKQKQSQLNDSILQKQQIIQQLNQQILSLKETLKNPFGQPHFNMDLFSPPDDDDEQENTGQQDSANKIKLSEDVEHKTLQYKISITQQKNISKIKSEDSKLKQEIIEMADIIKIPEGPPQTQIQRTISQTPSKSSSKIKKLINLDPYYCHYVLLSQTIKIVQNQWAFFNIDIKPFYKEIISQKVPMHEWREWILSKFLQIADRNSKSAVKNQSKSPKKTSSIQEKS